MGYEIREDIIVGPDNYSYKPLHIPAGRKISEFSLKLDKHRVEPFAGVRLRVSSLVQSLAFYTEVLGMKLLEEGDLEVTLGSIAEGINSAYVSYDSSHCTYQLIEDPKK